MDGLAFCAVPMFLGQSGECMWDKHELSYSVTTSLKGLSDDAWLAALKMAWGFWADVANIKAVYIEDAASADVLIATGAIDGPSGVLAWSEMPCGASDPDQLRQRFDSGELAWVVAENPSQGQLDIVRVACHEIGHVIGLPHFANGAPALLAPTYSTKIRRPQPMDIAAAQERYGPPTTPPTPIPPTPVPIPPVPNPPGGTMNWLAMLQALLALLAKLFPPTPAAPGTPASPGTIIDWIRRILTAFGAGAPITAEQLQASYEMLQLPPVTQAQMDAPIQSMMMG